MSTDSSEEAAQESPLNWRERAQLAAMQEALKSPSPELLANLQHFDCKGAIPQCREAVEALWLVVDDGCDIKLRERLEKHCKECTSCRVQYELEVRIKALLSKKCKHEPCAPEGLKNRLRGEIRGMLE